MSASTLQQSERCSRKPPPGPGASALGRDEVAASLKNGNAADALKKAAKTFSSRV